MTLKIFGSDHSNGRGPCGLTRTVLSAARAALLGIPLALAPATAGAKPWSKVGGWTVISLDSAPGCMMGTKYASGAVLVVSAKYDRGDGPAWEMLAADRAWQHIEADRSYPVDIHLLGTGQPVQRHEMHSYKASHLSGLVAKFTDFSDFSAYLSNGLAHGTHIAFSFDGRLIGTFALGDAGGAFEDLLRCYAHVVTGLKS